MAKQKLKVPLNRAAGRASSDADTALGLLLRKGKTKSAGKAKAVGKTKTGDGKIGPGSLPSGAGKGAPKSKRQKRPPGPAVANSATTLVAGLGAPLAALAKTIGRGRGVRPGPALGRLERLEIAIGEVRVGGRASARTRKLLASGMPKMAQKVIEEAAEVAIEAIRGDRLAFVNETVDLFYNLLVVSAELGVPLSAVWTEMDRREQALGMAEKLPKSGEP